MKGPLVCFMVLTLSIMLVTAALAGPAAPRTLCYSPYGNTPAAMMSLKNQGTIKSADGPLKHYSVHGTYTLDQLPPSPQCPLSGTASFKDGVLRFNHTCILRSDGEPGSDPVSFYYQQLTEGTFDTATGRGAVTTTFINLPSAPGSTMTLYRRNNYIIYELDCSYFSINPSAGADLSVPEMGEAGLNPMDNGLNLEFDKSRQAGKRGQQSPLHGLFVSIVKGR